MPKKPQAAAPRGRPGPLQKYETLARPLQGDGEEKAVYFLI